MRVVSENVTTNGRAVGYPIWGERRNIIQLRVYKNT